MSNGLLSWWRRRIVARGLAGAALFAVPVVVAALIGFGTSISGVTGGLSAVTSGPDAVPASAQPAPSKLNRALIALASKQDGSPIRSSPGADGGRGGGSTGTSTGSTESTGSGSSGSGSGSGTGSSPSPISVPSVPSAPVTNVPLPGGGSTSGTTDAVNGTVNNLLDGVNNTLNGLLGK